MRGALLPLLPLAALVLAPPACRFGYESVPGSGASGIIVGNAGETSEGLAGGGGTNAGGSSGTSGGADAGGTIGNLAGANDGMAGDGDATGATEGGGTGGMLGSGGAGGSGGRGVSGGSNNSGGVSSGGSSAAAGSSAASGTAGVSGASGRAGASGAGGRAGASGAGGRAGASGAGGRAGASGAGGASGSGGLAGAGNAGGAGGSTGVSLVVTTQADEADSAATPSSPGETGFSLREAITYANGQSGTPSITFASGVTTITLKSALPVVTHALTIQGTVALDASQNASTSACLSVSASNVLIDSVEIHDCKGEPVLLSSDSSSGNQVSNCYLHNNKKALVVHGSGATVFFDYVSFSAAAGIEIYGTSAQVLANEVVSNTGSNIVIHDGANTVFLLANLSIGGNEGITLGAVSGVTAWHNTVASPVAAAFDVGTATAIDARNNIFFGAGSYGILGKTAQFSNLDYDLYFADSAGNCSSCTPGSHSVFADPLFNNPSTLDYSLKAGSPAIDAGFDLGQDRNLSSPGLYNGNGPDLGFIEAN